MTISYQYDKAKKYAIGHGYERRIAAPTSVVIHSTSNPTVKNTPFASECKFLFNAALVSSHYLISKDGAIVQFLDPLVWAAWHAGAAKPAYSNAHSIGVELHHSVGDPPYPKEQMDALGALMVSLGGQFNIPFGMMDTHGQIALPGPYDRKHDPSDMAHDDFLLWRDQLQAPLTKSYRVKRRYITQRQEDNGPPIVRELIPGEVLVVDKMYSNRRVHFADGSGFGDLDDLEAV